MPRVERFNAPPRSPRLAEARGRARAHTGASLPSEQDSDADPEPGCFPLGLAEARAGRLAGAARDARFRDTPSLSLSLSLSLRDSSDDDTTRFRPPLHATPPPAPFRCTAVPLAPLLDAAPRDAGPAARGRAAASGASSSDESWLPIETLDAPSLLEPEPCATTRRSSPATRAARWVPPAPPPETATSVFGTLAVAAVSPLAPLPAMLGTPLPTLDALATATRAAEEAGAAFPVVEAAWKGPASSPAESLLDEDCEEESSDENSSSPRLRGGGRPSKPLPPVTGRAGACPR